MRESAPVLVATRNPGKAAELAALLAPLGAQIVTLAEVGVPPSAEEDEIERYDTFEANAVAKARFYHVVSGGLATIADDSGLEVDVLGGAPGVHSRRWASATGSAGDVDAANNTALLARLVHVGRRDARFTCVAAYIDGSCVVVGRGEVGGRIALTPRGRNGFGYDPVFEPAALCGRTFGEASPADKAALSHRAAAISALVSALRSAKEL